MKTAKRKKFLKSKLPSPDNIEVDFVFLIDITGSMQQKIDQVRRNVSKFTSSLMKRGIDYKIGLILFSDEIERVYQPTKDVLDFLDWLSLVKARGGKDEKENALEAIERGIEDIDFRQNANKVLVMVTDAPFHEADDIEGYGTTNHTKESIIKMLQINQTRLFSIVPPKLDEYREISKSSRGNTFDIDYPFSTVLDNFSNQLTNLYKLKYSSAKESIPDSIQISFFSGEQKKLVKKTIPIVELGRKLIIENLLFKTNKAELPPNVKELDLLAEFMEQKPNIAILIEGHTDNVGREEYNDYLSLKRAESVKNYLVEKGVDPIRIQTKGYGEQRPIATNATEFGRRLNRRTEIIIVAK